MSGLLDEGLDFRWIDLPDALHLVVVFVDDDEKVYSVGTLPPTGDRYATLCRRDPDVVAGEAYPPIGGDGPVCPECFATDMAYEVAYWSGV